MDFVGRIETLNKTAIKIFVNMLTIFRCIFTFAMPFLIGNISDALFLVIIAILFFTDCLDGFISRKCRTQTLFGSIMDTIADKVLCIVLILCIAVKSSVLYIVMIGEIVIATINFIGTLNSVPIVTIMMGKIKMWALAITTLLGYMYYFDSCDEILVTVSGIIVIIMQIIVGFEYGRRIKKVNVIRTEKLKFKRGRELAYTLFDTDYYLNTIDLPILKKLTVIEEN